MTDLIIDFPLQRHRCIAVHFAETLQTTDTYRRTPRRCSPWDLVHHSRIWPHETWNQERCPQNSSRDAAFACSGDDVASEEDSGYWIGIHLLTPACIDEVNACRARARCKHAVLAEQGRQDLCPSARFRLEAIAFASMGQTRKAVLRARKLVKLQGFHLSSLDCSSSDYSVAVLIVN